MKKGIYKPFVKDGEQIYTLRFKGKKAFGDFSLETSTSSSLGSYEILAGAGWTIKYTFDSLRNLKTHTEIKEGQQFKATLKDNTLINLEVL